MKAVVIGDIAWPDLYHLGDEAMTEAAIDMLRARGVDDITLVAGNPGVAEDFYGLPAVRRVRFRGDWSRGRNEWRLADVARVLAEEDWGDHPIYPAIRDADAVIIAGGGNMNSRDYHLLFERVAAKRIAEHFGTPLYITSQTVGPMLDEPDRDLIVELLDYATAFGAREGTTYEVLKSLAPDPSKVFRTLDDAILLEADDAARAAARELAGDRPYVAASFTWHAGAAWPTIEDYHAAVADVCRRVVDELDLDVLLVPHAGSFDPATANRDQESNDAIAVLAATERVRVTRMVTAREDVALIAGSAASLSTRYHPTVFAPASQTPAVAISPSYYSSIRMGGSLGNVGQGCFVVPAASIDLVLPALREATQRGDDLISALAKAGTAATSFQAAWWDALMESVSSHTPVEFGATFDIAPFAPTGAWSATNEDRKPLTDRYVQAQEDLTHISERVELLTAQLEAARAARSKAEARERKSSETLARYRNRKVIRFLDRLGR
ncbi:polysaccharide pyruvyl transferase family protein [Demequina sp. NBRC 110055]|uniref:polysaccharide pyruvyl transferase family protein n=1 Tax=Demequina sp. NBRC 110055 TaxID=1570344 RepID=UPI000A014CC2|nr:polysaccharide pyruvyl transferase family protein [Demequina sp. NBRC 110055]